MKRRRFARSRLRTELLLTHLQETYQQRGVGIRAAIWPKSGGRLSWGYAGVRCKRWLPPALWNWSLSVFLLVGGLVLVAGILAAVRRT